MTTESTSGDELRAYEENPFNRGDVRPEDLVRIFYSHDIPVIPVVSKRGILLGILRKDDVIAELSDIERVRSTSIDTFITGLARRMSLDDLLSYGSFKTFPVINIFGEQQGDWSRIELFSAAEGHRDTSEREREVDQTREEQSLEWLIYTILEHIPRALYALNTGGKTIFYNSHFEGLWEGSREGEVDPLFVEKALLDMDRNELISDRNGEDLLFYNHDLKAHYEKVPMKNRDETIGYLIFFQSSTEQFTSLRVAGIDIREMGLSEIMEAVEQRLIRDSLAHHDSRKEAAHALGVSPKTLAARIKKFGISEGRPKKE
jgi:hypothetical protein